MSHVTLLGAEYCIYYCPSKLSKCKSATGSSILFQYKENNMEKYNRPPPHFYFFVVLSKFNINLISRNIIYLYYHYDNGTFIININITALIIVISSFQPFEDNVIKKWEARYYQLAKQNSVLSSRKIEVEIRWQQIWSCIMENKEALASLKHKVTLWNLNCL